MKINVKAARAAASAANERYVDLLIRASTSQTSFITSVEERTSAKELKDAGFINADFAGGITRTSSSLTGITVSGRAFLASLLKSMEEESAFRVACRFVLAASAAIFALSQFGVAFLEIWKAFR